MTADLKELAKSIAASENPYAEFDKHASDLDDTHTQTLSRELNRQLFLRNLSNAELNNDIEFGIIDSGSKNGAVESSGDPKTEKVASDVAYVDRAHLVTDDMFLLSRDDNKMIKMAAQGSDKMFDEQIIADNDEIALIKTAELLEKKAESKNRAIRQFNEIEYQLLDALVKQASHEGVLRSYMSMMVQADKTDLIEPLLLSSNYSMNDIQKTASEELPIAEKEAIDVILTTMKGLDSSFTETSKEDWLDDDVEDKIAGLGTMIYNIGKKGVNLLGKGAGNTMNGVSSVTGKAILGAGHGAVGAGKLAWKHKKTTGGLLMAGDITMKAEGNREKIVDGLM